MNKKNYIVATIRRWNIQIFNDTISKYPGNWHLITKPAELTKELVRKLNPRYIFFPHWSYVVPGDILELTECVCFHETDLPYGRGGSPVQNLIANGHNETMISAIKMNEEIDSGPIYLKRPLILDGLAEEIFIRASKIIAEMILEIVQNEPQPKEQDGQISFFKRRTPDQSEISLEFSSLGQLFDHLRMLDADEYPHAFIRYGNFKFEFSRSAFRTNYIEADVRITLDAKEKKNK